MCGLWLVYAARADTITGDAPQAGTPQDTLPLRAGGEGVTQFAPGMEVRLEAPKAKNFFLVYVPEDYTPERPWPIIFCYHGYRGRATTSPFMQATDGQGFIIVGMNYATEEYHLRLGVQRTGPERAFFDEALAIVSSRLNVDPTLVFMGGFSQGGYSTTVLGEQLLDKLAGLIVLGGGRTYVDGYPPPARQIVGKAIFIGVGEKDEVHNPRAKNAVDIYKSWGAAVTFEEWSGVGHSFDRAKSTKLLDWLLANGPLKHVQSKLTEAREAEKAGKLGLAFTLYHQLSQVSQTDASCIEAAKAADVLTQRAEAQLAEAEKAMAEKPYPEATKLLEQIAKVYAGSVFAERAQAHRKTLLNTKADELEARARAAERAGNYAKAVQLYEFYLIYFPDADHYHAVKTHLEPLKTQIRGQ